MDARLAGMAVHAATEPLAARRWAATGTASLLLHALLLGMLARTKVTQLVLQPPGLLLLLGREGEAPGQPAAASAEAARPGPLPAVPAAPAAAVATERVPADAPPAAVAPPRDDLPLQRQPDRLVETPPPAARSKAVRPKPAQPEDARRGDSAPAMASAVPSPAAPAGSGGGGASQAAPDAGAALRTAYEQQLFLWLEKHKDYPLVARRRGLEGVATLRVRIARDGHVLGTTMVQGSGEPMLDAATLDLAARADPFPRVPATIEGGEFEFTVPVEYRLR